jgi:hypothetical protein
MNSNILKFDITSVKVINVDKIKCMACKSIKENDIQCHLKPKPGSIFCGRHKNTKQHLTFNKINSSLKKHVIDCKTNNTNNSNKNKVLINSKNKFTSSIITLSYFYDNSDLSKCTKKSIRESYHHYCLDYYCEHKEKNIDVMLIQLKELFKRILYYSIPENLKQIIFLQKIFKKHKLKLKNYYRGPAWNNIDKCNNDSDFFNFDKLKEIPPKYRITYIDNDNFIYGFHLYSLRELLSRGHKNPYTLKEFPKELYNKVNKYISIIEKQEKLHKINNSFYNKNKIKLNKINNNDNITSLAGNIIEKAQEAINNLPIKQLSQIQCNQTFTNMAELGYQVNSIWLYGKTIKQLSKFIIDLKHNYDKYNFQHLELTEEQLHNIPLIQLVNDINNHTLNTNNRFKFLQKVLSVLNYMFDTLGIGDCKNTISIIIIQSLVILEPNAVRSNNPWIQ